VSVGQLIKQWEMTSMHLAHSLCLRIGPFRSGNRVGARVRSTESVVPSRSFDFGKEARLMGEMAKFSRYPVCKNKCKLP
jgi:hypothetical protein